MQDLIRKYALENAVKFKGKANPGAIIGKLLSKKPELKDELKDLQPKIQKIVNEINSMSIEKQLEEHMKLAPEVKKHEEKNMFASLNIEQNNIITAFPPGVEKYPHIGHAKAITLNTELAKQYNGKFFLRFEDTNPKLVKKEFYEIMIENFKWLGIQWDRIDYASDHMDLFYNHAQRLVEDGHAYMCTCNTDQIKESRMKSLPCACRALPVLEHIQKWDQFKVMKEGSAVLRLKIDLEHKNSTMRDPTIFRIIDHAHARHNTKYRVWPNYDFQNSVMDGESGITHRIRSKEFEMRDELQAHIQKLLNYNITNIYSIGRLNLEGVPTSGRIIREKLENKELIGWDDPTLTTIVALRRRGFTPEAIKSFVLSTGISKAEATLTWDDLIVQNRRILDSEANRYFFVWDPIEITIKNTPDKQVEHKLHPDDPERGKRIFNIDGRFFLTKEDYDQIEEGKIYRLMDCINFTKQNNEFVFHSEDYQTFKEEGEKIIHYLPKTNLTDVEILMPNKEIIKGLAEPMQINEGDIIQFERFGFCRLDKDSEPLKFWYTHK